MIDSLLLPVCTALLITLVGLSIWSLKGMGDVKAIVASWKEWKGNTDDDIKSMKDEQACICNKVAEHTTNLAVLDQRVTTLEQKAN